MPWSEGLGSDEEREKEIDSTPNKQRMLNSISDWMHASQTEIWTKQTERSKYSWCLDMEAILSNLTEEQLNSIGKLMGYW